MYFEVDIFFCRSGWHRESWCHLFTEEIFQALPLQKYYYSTGRSMTTPPNKVFAAPFFSCYIVIDTVCLYLTCMFHCSR